MARFYCSIPGCPHRWENRTMKAKRPRCCGKPMTQVKRVRHGAGDLQVLGDVPEHFNPAFDAVVTGRRSLRELQRATGSVDYEPSARQKERNAYALDRMKFEANRR